MAIYTIKVPDVGEGVAETELAEWNVSVGDFLREDEIFASIMTDKATMEIPSSATGTVIWLAAEEGDTIAVGADLIKLEISDQEEDTDHMSTVDVEPGASISSEVFTKKTANAIGEKPLASPSVRKRAAEQDVDLRAISGTGRGGIVTREDLDTYLESKNSDERKNPAKSSHEVNEKKIVGLRRKIAERMANANARIPHITIVEEIDVTGLEELRARLNIEKSVEKPKLTILPFILGAMVRALGEQPSLNAHFDDEAEILREFQGIHVGIAAQTANGLMVPVVKNCEKLDLWQSAAELLRVTEAAKNGSANRDELSGSTITITSLGALGAIATTPIINHPEVAIVGVNRIAIRPSWDGEEFVPRKMMNISCSFDHRVIDGWDAAVFVNRMKELLEEPSAIVGK